MKIEGSIFMIHITQQLVFFLFSKTSKLFESNECQNLEEDIGNIEFPNPTKHSIDVNFTIKSHF